MKKILIVLSTFVLTSCVPFWPSPSISEPPISPTYETTTDPTSQPTSPPAPTTVTTPGPVTTGQTNTEVTTSTDTNNYSYIDLTVDSLNIPSSTYFEGSSKINGISFSFIQIGNYGNGIQMRDSNGNTSKLWNTNAFENGISKIELTYSATKNMTYPDEDGIIFNFGNEVQSKTYETVLSTVEGIKTYTVIPEKSSYQYFYLEHNTNHSYYWDSIKVYYNDDNSHGSTTNTTTSMPTTSPTTSEPEITTAPSTIELTSLEITGSMTKKVYNEDETDWDLTGLKLYEIYSDSSASLVGDLESIRNDIYSPYNITIWPELPQVGITELEISITNDYLYNVSCEIIITGIVVNGKNEANNYYAPNDYELASNLPLNYEQYSNYYVYNFQYCPAQEDVNVLVLPIAFKDSTKDTTKTLNDIKIAFNGTENETGWESVSTFFNKASFYNFSPTFTIAPAWYQSSINKSTAGTMDAFDTASLIEEAVDWYKTTYSEQNGKEFDKDKDGYIDCVIAIYAENNYSIANNSYENFWAYCFSRQEQDASTTSPTSNMFVWASYDFMYSSQGSGSGYIDIDTHTYIHEFGHALGLDDYYDYSYNSEPAGGFDMQDYNVGDHNSFSKFALGWEKPYVVYGDSEITLKSSALYENQFIIVPAGGFNNWNRSPFDEYILLEYYTPEGLNEFDVTHPTYGYNTQGPNARGVRAYHIDARLYELRLIGDSLYADGYTDSLNSGDYAIVAATNSGSGSGYESVINEAVAYDFVHLLSASGTDRFKTTSFLSSQDLFTKGDKFSMSTFKNFFPKTGKMNDGLSLGFEFEITELDNESVTIKFTTV